MKQWGNNPTGNPMLMEFKGQPLRVGTQQRRAEDGSGGGEGGTRRVTRQALHFRGGGVGLKTCSRVHAAIFRLNIYSQCVKPF